MPSTGALNMGGTSSPVSVNYELGKASPYQQTVSMNDSAVRSLAGVSGTSGSSWSMSSLYGKSAGFTTVSLSTVPSDTSAYYNGSFTIEALLIFQLDGVWETQENTFPLASGNWGSPTNSGAGSNYWIKFTRTGFTPVGGGEYSTPTTGWLNLGSDRIIQVYTYFDNIDSSSAVYTIQIATDSAGSNIIATRTGVSLIAVSGTPPY